MQLHVVQVEHLLGCQNLLQGRIDKTPTLWQAGRWLGRMPTLRALPAQQMKPIMSGRASSTEQMLSPSLMPHTLMTTELPRIKFLFCQNIKMRSQCH